MKNFFLEGLLSAPSFNPKSLRHPIPWAGHIPFAYWLVKQASPKVFVELGTYIGNSYFSFCQSVKEEHLQTKCFAVDTWMGDDHCGSYGDEVFDAVKNHHDTNYSDFSRLLRMTFDEAVNSFPDKSINILHIDGLHTYEAVKHDFETWLPKMASGGIILFHDTNVHERGFGVARLWDELVKLYPYSLEFIHSHGLGVLQVSACEDGHYYEWLNPDFQCRSQLKEFFAGLGNSLIEKFVLEESKKHIQSLDSQLFSANKQILFLNEINTNLNAQVIKFSNEITGLQNQINFWLASISSCPTKPFRSLAKALKKIIYPTGQFLLKILRFCYASLSTLKLPKEKLKALFYGPFSFFQQNTAVYKQSFQWVKRYLVSGGSLKSLIKKSISVYRKDGFSGVARVIGNISRIPVVDSRKQYLRWLEFNHEQLKLDPEKIKDLIIEFSIRPKISIVLPTYNSNLKWLSEAIESVREQVYENWELCIADDASTNPCVRDLLLNYAERDSRIKLLFLEENGHISKASNSSLSLASGDWVGFLDHDDLLTPDALFWVAHYINANHSARLIYSDEDKLDESGLLTDPYFKPDWNRELFYGHNLITHFAVFAKSLLVEIGGFRAGFDGAQDYDLALRCIERIPSSSIVHIPRVLYHWRVHDISTAKKIEAKPYSMLAGGRALKEHFIRRGINADPELIGHGYRIRYQLPTSPPLVSLIIPTRNGLSYLKKCIESILARTKYENYEILIIDNDSDDPETLSYLGSIIEAGRVKVIPSPGPFNYSELNNKAVDLAKGEIIGLLNNDIEVIEGDWLSEMVSRAILPDVGAVGPKLLYGDGSLQHAGIILGIGGWAGHSHKGFPGDTHGYVARVSLAGEFSAVTGACLIVRKEIFRKAGGLDAENLTIACNDVDFCLKVNELGFRNVYTPFATLYHHESATRGYEDTPEKKLRFKKELDFMLKKWGNKINNDPMYSPNLTLDSENFGFAWPTRLQRPRSLVTREIS
jgi:GT2 family glycosyltransferase